MIFSVLGLEMLDKDHRYGTFCSKYVRIKPKFYFYYRQCCRHWIRTNSSWRPCPSLMAIEYRCGIKMRLVCLALAALPQVLFIWMQTLFTWWIQPQFVDQMQGFFTFIAPFSSLFHSLFTRVIFLKCQLPLRWDRRPKNDKDRPQTTPHPELRGEFWGTVGVARDAIESSTRLVYNGMICFFWSLPKRFFWSSKLGHTESAVRTLTGTCSNIFQSAICLREDKQWKLIGVLANPVPLPTSPTHLARRSPESANGTCAINPSVMLVLSTCNKTDKHFRIRRVEMDL